MLIVVFLTIGVLLLGVAPNADAVFKIRISSAGSPTLLVEDEDFSPAGTNPPNTNPDAYGDDPLEIPGAGTVSFLGSIGAFNIIVTTGVADPVLPQGHMDLIQLAVSGGPGTVTIELSYTGFTQPMPNPGFVLTVGGTTTSSVVSPVVPVTVNSYFDDGNVLFGKAGTGPTLSFTTPSYSGSAASAAGPAFAPYSLTLEAVVVHGAGGGESTSFDAYVQPVPEPGTLFLLGSGLVGLAGYAKLRLKRRKT